MHQTGGRCQAYESRDAVHNAGGRRRSAHPAAAAASAGLAAAAAARGSGLPVPPESQNQIMYYIFMLLYPNIPYMALCLVEFSLKGAPKAIGPVRVSRRSGREPRRDSQSQYVIQLMYMYIYIFIYNINNISLHIYICILCVTMLHVHM